MALADAREYRALAGRQRPPQSRDWLANRLSKSVTRLLRAHLGRPVTVEFISG